MGPRIRWYYSCSIDTNGIDGERVDQPNRRCIGITCSGIKNIRKAAAQNPLNIKTRARRMIHAQLIPGQLIS